MAGNGPFGLGIADDLTPDIAKRGTCIASLFRAAATLTMARLSLQTKRDGASARLLERAVDQIDTAEHRCTMTNLSLQRGTLEDFARGLREEDPTVMDMEPLRRNAREAAERTVSQVIDIAQRQADR